jgi:hypothetical protein
MNQPPLFDVDEVSGAAIAPEPDRYELHGESVDGIGMLQGDVIAWSFEGGIWWATGADGSITGYNFDRYYWLSFRKQVL